MLRHSFCHIPKINPDVERMLWDSGILTWEDLPSSRSHGLPESRHSLCCEHVANSLEQLKKRNVTYFYEALPNHEHWRLFEEFRRDTAYLDIETTGLSPEWDEITTIALYDGTQVKGYVNGINLQDFRTDITRFKQIVTFNGKCFDVPFIRKKLRLNMSHAHLDLRYILKRLGYSGGLKGCEQTLGIKRRGVENVDGFMAVLLWQEYQKGNDKALETLLAYNMADAVNLETLMVIAFNKKLQETPFGGDLKLPLPKRPVIPHRPDQRTIKRIQLSL